jgi:hypothetical protein
MWHVGEAEETSSEKADMVIMGSDAVSRGFSVNTWMERTFSGLMILRLELASF